jgi:hypothetical protein
MTTITDKAGPIEVWLSQDKKTVTCRVVYEDESTEHFNVESLSMRGAQREITGWLIREGYKPDGRWTAEAEDSSTNEELETWRRFELAS